jgi:hypothetical protein
MTPFGRGLLAGWSVVLCGLLLGATPAASADLYPGVPRNMALELPLAVDYSENGRFGKNGLDLIQHGPVMGISLRW